MDVGDTLEDGWLMLDDGWLALAGVGAGYALAVGLVFLLVFVAPYLAVAAL